MTNKYRAALKVFQNKRFEDQRDEKLDRKSPILDLPKPYIMPDGSKRWSFGGKHAVHS